MSIAEAIELAPTIAARAQRSQLHILTLTPFYPSEASEVNGCFVAESLTELNARGVLSSVMAVDSIYHARRISNVLYPAEWIRYPQLPGNFGLASAGTFLSTALFAKIKRLHQHSPIHLIHSHSALPCGHAAKLISQRLGIPIVVTIHGLDVFNSCFEGGLAARWRRKASIHVYQHARKVICISQKVRQLLIDTMGPEINAEVVYNGTDSALFAPRVKIEPTLRPSILMVGNLLAGKGHDLVIRAIARLQDSHPDVQCDIIGEGADRNRFASLAENLGISDRVHFLGRRSRSEVAQAMRNCTIFVLPSRYEGLGCVYLEAMSCAKPVIACEGQGIAEIIAHGSNGWLIPIDGFEELSQGLRTLLSEAQLRARIGEAARKTIVNGLTLFHQAEKLLKIYEETKR
ncbi:MAG: glycosyltransferase [Candidatus Sulfotelmatobacter sp.]